MNKKNRSNNRTAKLLTVISVAFLMFGIITGTLLSQKNPDTKARSYGEQVPETNQSKINVLLYNSVSPIGRSDNIPAEIHPDKNIKVRGYQSSTKSPALYNIEGPTDEKAPQLATLLDRKDISLIRAYQVYDWNWSSNAKGNLIEDPEISMLGIATTPGEALHVPNSGYFINPGLQVMILYADNDSITLHYTLEDDVSRGYSIHVLGIKVDQELLDLYNSLNSTGRNSLPAMAGNQIFGYTEGSEVKVSVRDTGSFMDIRSKKDWWRGVGNVIVPTISEILTPTYSPIVSTPTSPPILPSPTIPSTPTTPILPSPTIPASQNIPSPTGPTTPSNPPQLTTIPTPSISSTPTPTKTMIEVIATNPIFTLVQDLSAKIVNFFKTSLP